MNIKRTLGILTLSALSYMTLGCEPRKVSEKTETPAVAEVAKPAELPTDRKGITKRSDYVAEIDFEKGTILFYQNGANANMAIEYRTSLPEHLQTDELKQSEGENKETFDQRKKEVEKQAREYAATITYGLHKLIAHGRNGPHKAQIASTETHDYTARTEYSGKEIIETYFHNLDGNDGTIDGLISGKELKQEKVQKWLKLSNEEFRNEFPLTVDYAAKPQDFGASRKPSFQELLEQERKDGNALGDSLRRAKSDSARLEAAYKAEATKAELYGKTKSEAEAARYEGHK